LACGTSMKRKRKETMKPGLFKTGKARLGDRLFNIQFIEYTGLKRILDSSERQWNSVSEKKSSFISLEI